MIKYSTWCLAKNYCKSWAKSLDNTCSHSLMCSFLLDKSRFFSHTDNVSLQWPKMSYWPLQYTEQLSWTHPGRQLITDSQLLSAWFTKSTSEHCSILINNRHHMCLHNSCFTSHANHTITRVTSYSLSSIGPSHDVPTCSHSGPEFTKHPKQHRCT